MNNLEIERTINADKEILKTATDPKHIVKLKQEIFIFEYLKQGRSYPGDAILEALQ